MMPLAMSVALFCFQSGDKLADGSRAVFSPLIEFVVEGRVLIVRPIFRTKEQLRAALDSAWEEMGVSVGVCQSPLGSKSVGGDSVGSNATILFQPRQALEYFSWVYYDNASDRLIELRQTRAGAIRFALIDSKQSTVFAQSPSGDCRLLYTSSQESKSWFGASFHELMLNARRDGMRLLIEPLEKYFSKCPLTPYSPAVISELPQIRGLDDKERASLAASIEELRAATVEDRDKAQQRLVNVAQVSASHLIVMHTLISGQGDPEVVKRLEAVVNACKVKPGYLIARLALFKDLEYLVSLCSADPAIVKQLRGVTGQTFESEQEWKEWIKQNRDRLEWSAESWRYRVK